MIFEEVSCAQIPHLLKAPEQCSRPTPRALPTNPTLRLSATITTDPLFLEKPNSFLLLGVSPTVCLSGCSPIPSLLLFPSLVQGAQPVLGSGALSATFTAPFPVAVLPSFRDSSSAVGLIRPSRAGILPYGTWTGPLMPPCDPFFGSLDWMNGNPALDIPQLLSQKGFLKLLIHVSVVDALTVESLLIHASWLRKEHVVSQLHPGFPHIYTHWLLLQMYPESTNVFRKPRQN